MVSSLRPTPPVLVAGAFIWDDEFFVLHHPAVSAGWPGLRALWTTFGSDPSRFVATVHYWPVLYTTFWFDHALWGGWAPGYHATNVAFHALNACLAWRLLTHFRVPGAWWAAVIFALHPGQVEPVAWIIGRKDVLAGTFVLLSVTVWLRFLAVSFDLPRFRLGFLFLLLLLYVLGAWSKSSALILPALLLVLRWWTVGRLSLRDLSWFLPLAVTGSLLLLLEFFVFDARAVLPEYSFLDRVLIAVRAFWTQFAILLWPYPLPVLYPRWVVSSADPVAWIGFVLIFVLPALLWCLRTRFGRGSLAAWLWFLVCLLPTLGLALHEYMHFAFVADRYRYLAILGPAVFGAAVVFRVAGLLQLWVSSPVLIPVRLVLLLSLVVLSSQHVALYTSSLDFWTHVRAHRPDAIMGYDNVASTLLAWERSQQALHAADLAVSRFPLHVRSHAVQVRARYATGDWSGTLEAADRFSRLTFRCRASPWKGHVAYMAAGCHSSDRIRAGVLVHRALALWRLGRVRAATETLRAARDGLHPAVYAQFLRSFPPLPPVLSGDLSAGPH